MKITVKTIINLLDDEYEIHGQGMDNHITHVKSTTEADLDSLVWISPTRTDKHELIAETKSNVIIGDYSLSLSGDDFENKILIRVYNPKLTFIKIVDELFVDKISFEIHPSAVIHPEAKIHKNVYIGANTYVGKSEINEGTIIYGNVYIYDGVKIGKNVTIEAGCSIGAAGYNFAKDEHGRLHKFPHLGGVIIHDDVEIQALSVIDRGVLGDTIIGKGTKIDSCCYVAHNCNIGENNAIIGHTMLSGSVKTGKYCWLAPATVIRDQVSIGNDCFTGMGSAVIKNLEDNAKVMGSPARPIDDMKKILKTLEAHIKDEN